MRLFLFLTLFLVLCALTVPLFGIRCFQCQDCTDRMLVPEKCPDNIKGCVTARTFRSHVVRDCYSDDWKDRGCNYRTMANKTCMYCDDADGCNGEEQDPIVCRSCDWTPMGQCDASRVCRAPFRTESGQCYILYRFPFGFHFGCLDEISKTIEFLMAQDRHKLTYFICDSNDCNRHAELFWPAYESLLEPFRICEVCRENGTWCGPKVCSLDSIYSHFCLRTFDQNAERSCLGDNTYVHLKALMETGAEIICNTNMCNDKDAKPLFKCVDEQNIYRPKDGCSWYLTPARGEYSLGRTLIDSCTDGKRCKICHYDNCNGYNRTACYSTNGGTDGLYIRRGQVDKMDTCAREEVCSFRVFEGNVTRGCRSMGIGPPRPGETICNTNLCNRQIASIYCFTCQVTDPNCVFSQHDGPFELCLLGTIGCFTRIFKDNSVSRGCAQTRNDPNNSTAYEFVFCAHSNLCNGQTTKFHSCNFLQLNLAFLPNIEVPQEYWEKPQQQGWAFESCPDSEGLPACYMKSDFRELTYGCTNDLADYDLVSYQRGSLFQKLTFCDGHYCNTLPDIKDPKKRFLN